MEFLKSKTEIVQHVLKMWYILSLPRYLKEISSCGFLCAFKYAAFCHFRLMSNVFKRNWKEVVFTQIRILPRFSQRHEPNKPKARVLATY
jgi:hypothetical protein